jgi:hypothetical protein
MIDAVADRRLLTHLQGVWSYLRVGLAGCSAFFIIGASVALFQNSHALLAVMTILVALFLMMLRVAGARFCAE